MSQPAKKRPAPPIAAVTDEVRDEEGSGRFMIALARSSSTMLPPTSPVAEAAQTPDALPLLEPDAVDTSADPQRGMVSGVFSQSVATADQARDDELENAVASMHAYYRESERQQHERAQLVIEDFSLLPDNPYGASSLVPPARKPLALGKVLGWVAVVAALGTGAWFVQRETSSARNGAAPSASVVVAAPAHAAMSQALVADAERPKSDTTQPAAVVAVAALPATSTADREDKPAPAPQVLVASARKASGSTPVEVARPAAAPSHKEAVAHDATAEAALRAVLAGSASDSASGAKAETTAIPSETSVASTNGTAPVLPSGASSESATSATPAPVDALGALPDLPAREDVVAGFEHVREELSKCAGDKHGTVQVDAVIANSGRVSRALIDGVFRGTAEGSCMARAARAARFPQFSQPSLSVSYPIAL